MVHITSPTIVRAPLPCARYRRRGARLQGYYFPTVLRLTGSDAISAARKASLPAPSLFFSHFLFLKLSA
ncbi:MAG: hypothetical protein C0183_15395 [Roseiflexus castenholzii]|nr:MAG: hypothetical protein C0183_15395 [Roseiflexus castenholzii]